MIKALNMIVKNEAHVIERCLDSVLYIHPDLSYVFVQDNGSTDNTMELIREWCRVRQVVCALYSVEWFFDWAQQRNHALEYMERYLEDAGINLCDVWCQLIDADEYLEPMHYQEPDYTTCDVFDMLVDASGFEFPRTSLINVGKRMRYEGIVHECLSQRDDVVVGAISVRVISKHEGARNAEGAEKKCAADAELLAKRLAECPTDTRARFFYARALHIMKMYEDALVDYKRCAEDTKDEDEKYYAQFLRAQVVAATSSDPWEVINTFLRVWQLRPTRSEPLGYAAMHARKHAHFALAVMLSRQASMIPRPIDRMQVEMSWYTWRSLDEFSVSASHLAVQLQDEGLLKEAMAAMHFLLKQSYLPDVDAVRIKGNLDQLINHFGVKNVA